MHRYLLLAAMPYLASCSAPTEDSRPDRPARVSLLERLDVLDAREFVASSDGAWIVRRRAALPPSTDTAFDSDSWSSAVGLGGGDGGRFGGKRAGSDDRRLGDPGIDRADTDAEVASSEVAPDAAESTGLAPLATRARDAVPLRAGSTDDNADFDAFAEYLRSNAESVAGRTASLDVFDRRSICVVDRAGTPVPAAEVVLVDEDADTVVWRGTTLGDGRFSYYPGVAQRKSGPLLVEVRAAGRFLRHHWNGEGSELRMALPFEAAARDGVLLDVVFLIDTTGSMADEIRRIQATLLSVTRKLENLDREFDLRYGAVLYRDVADAYVTKAHAFTSDLAAFDEELRAIEARGGGDTPESLNQGLAVAIDGLEWRTQAAKLVFLIADAPPHMDYENDVPYDESIVAAVARGIRIHSVAASGLDEAGTYAFRQIAQFTRGRFIFIEYGGDVKKTAEGHGVTAPVASNNLDDILFERIRDEIATWGRP